MKHNLARPSTLIVKSIKTLGASVLLGAMLTMMVSALALVRWSPDPDSIRYFTASPTDDRVLYMVTGFGVERIGLAPESVKPEHVLYQIDVRPQPWWRTLLVRTNEPRRIRFVDAVGFPFRSMYCVWKYSKAYLEGPLVLDTIESEHLRGGLSLGDIDRIELTVVDNWLAVPLTPIWSGLASNLTLYSLVGFAVLRVRRKAMRLRMFQEKVSSRPGQASR